MPRPKSQSSVLAGFFFFLSLIQPVLCEEYLWSGPVEQALIAPTDTAGSEITGASVQGGLVDLRYGQASIDIGGVGLILDWNENTLFTLNGVSCRATALTDLLEKGDGLTVAVRYNPASGLMGWMDAVHATSVPAVTLILDPWKAILTPGEKLVVTIDPAESKRLRLESPTLFAPGMAHKLPFRRYGRLGWRAELPIMSGWNWKELPLFLVMKNGNVLRGLQVSVSATGPSIGDSGPQVASEFLDSIPGWFQLEGNLMFLDPTSIHLTASNGARITQVFPRRDRVDFNVEVVGAGTYWVEATIADLSGREARKIWSFVVRR